MNRAACFANPIRRVLFVLATLLLAGSVQAQWMPLGRTDDFHAFLDQKSIRKNGNFVQVRQLMDFATTQWVDGQTVVGSIRSLIEYDCSQLRSRTLVAEAFSEQMAGGRMVASEQLSDPQWERVEPASGAGKIRKIACGD